MKRAPGRGAWIICLRLVAVLALPPTAQAELVEIAWDAAGRFERQLPVAPGGFVELCDKFPIRTLVQWQFDADGATDFNIHFHEGKVVRFPAKKDAVTSADGTLDVSREEDYCWMWSSKSTRSTQIKVILRRFR